MEHIVDFHIHSHYSRATSKEMNIASLYRWGKIKGIHVIGTGDFTHPAWFAELRAKLEPAEDGLFKLKEKYAKEQDMFLSSKFHSQPIRFMLTVEISNIYSKAGSVRKLHNLIIVPSFEAASKIIDALRRIGNLQADGRPILGMDSKDLLKITLASDPQALFIPAHIWTPWFSLFGSNSGFDSIREAFEELAGEIKAVETGLSSDPFMNWRVEDLDRITLVSNSDAHSPPKLGREANIIHSELSYKDIINAVKTGDERFVGTIEFFPQEGKYHYDGHRACRIRFSPQETKKHGGICPKCNRPLTLGVDYRVDKLANRPKNYKPHSHKKVEYIIPLAEILAEIFEVKSATSQRVKAEYEKITNTFGDEFAILRTVPTSQIKDGGFGELAEALDKLRAGDVHVEPGYDGVFGVIKVFDSKVEQTAPTDQLSLGF